MSRPATWLRPWQAYAERVIRRLRNGERDYGDSSLSRDPLDLCREIRDELADLAGWSVWLDARVARVERMVKALRVELQRMEGVEL